MAILPFFIRDLLSRSARSYSGYAFMPPPQLGVAAWSLADLKADCKLLDLPVSGNKGQLFSRLQGYVDGTVRPKKKRRR